MTTKDSINQLKDTFNKCTASYIKIIIGNTNAKIGRKTCNKDALTDLVSITNPTTMGQEL